MAPILDHLQPDLFGLAQETTSVRNLDKHQKQCYNSSFHLLKVPEVMHSVMKTSFFFLSSTQHAINSIMWGCLSCCTKIRFHYTVGGREHSKVKQEPNHTVSPFVITPLPVEPCSAQCDSCQALAHSKPLQRLDLGLWPDKRP